MARVKLNNRNASQPYSMTVVEYTVKMDDIIIQMLRVLIRAQRKIDDAAYRDILKKLDNL